MRKLVIGLTVAASMLFCLSASAGHDMHGLAFVHDNVLIAADMHPGNDLIPGIEALDAPVAPATTATYALNGSEGMQGVMWSFKDFRTVADSGGALA